MNVINLYRADPHRFPPLLWEVDDGSERWMARGTEEEVKVDLRVSHPGYQIITHFSKRKRGKPDWLRR